MLNLFHKVLEVRIMMQTYCNYIYKNNIFIFFILKITYLGYKKNVFDHIQVKNTLFIRKNNLKIAALFHVRNIIYNRNFIRFSAYG